MCIFLASGEKNIYIILENLSNTVSVKELSAVGNLTFFKYLFFRNEDGKLTLNPRNKAKEEV